MKRFTIIILLCLPVIMALSQQRIDGTFAFQNDPAKKYSIFIPANYDPAVPNPVMLGLHPLNTSRWNAKSWCDTLTTFAKDDDLIVICPDGGADGRIDDPIDTAFTTFLLDTMFKLYNVDENNVYVMGFSWGGLTTFTYGLRRAHKFAGFMPIGPAVNGTSMFNDVLPNARSEPFFYINGAKDSPNNRFHPVVNALRANQACVEDTLIPGVGHTIDFPGHAALFSMGYNWLLRQNCGLTSVNDISNKETIVTPNPIRDLSQLKIISEHQFEKVVLYDMSGQEIGRISDLRNELNSGIYFIKVIYKDGDFSTHKITVTH